MFGCSTFSNAVLDDLQKCNQVWQPDAGINTHIHTALISCHFIILQYHTPLAKLYVYPVKIMQIFIPNTCFFSQTQLYFVFNLKSPFQSHCYAAE